MNDTFFHLCAYYASVSAGATNSALTAINDSILTKTTSTSFILPKPCQLRAGYFGGVGCDRARINTPSLRYVGLPYFGPSNNTITVPSPPNITDWSASAPIIPQADEISVEVTSSDAGAQNMMAALWFSPGVRAPQPGPRYRLRYTAAITGVTGAWANGTMSPDQTLPAGLYMVCGMDAIGTNLALARLVFANGGWRPGVLARNADSNVGPDANITNSLGALGIFDSVNTPNLDIFCVGACSAQEVYLDVTRLSGRV